MRGRRGGGGQKYKICYIFYISVAFFFQKIDQSMIDVTRAAVFVTLIESAPLQLLKCCGISMINMTFKWLKCWIALLTINNSY